MYKRLFTFGCSYTMWRHPTWADILSWDLKIPYQNWGISGIGNVCIHCRMLECDLINKFTEDDLIIVLWSTWTREDRYLNDNWHSFGNVFNNDFYKADFIKKYWSFSNDIIKNSTAIISANRMFKINFQGNIADYLEGERLVPKYITDTEKALFLLYKTELRKQEKNIFNLTEKPFKGLTDNHHHPDVLQHMSYLQNFICPTLNIKLSNDTINYCNNLQEYIIKTTPLPLQINQQDIKNKINGDGLFYQTALKGY